MLKDISGFESHYAITDDGQVWSYKSNKFLKPTLTAQGRLRVGLIKDGVRQTYLIHRLVGEAFLPNPLGLPQLNHKDEDPTNNRVSNLEWCDNKYNCNYGTRTQRSANGHKKPIYCVELDRVFASAADAARELNIDNSTLAKVCKGKKNTCGGYHWCYWKEVE